VSKDETIDELFGYGDAAVDWWLTGGIPSANCLAAYQPKGAASLAASYSNLANPGTYDAAPGTAPTWAAGTGWVFNGSTQYLTTGLTPLEDWSIFVQFTNATNDGYILGACPGLASNERNFTIAPARGGGGTKVRYWKGTDATTDEVAPAATAGNLAICYRTAYRDGSIDKASLLAWTGTQTPAAMMLGCLGFGVSPLIYCAAYIRAVAIYDTDVSAYAAGLAGAMAGL